MEIDMGLDVFFLSDKKMERCLLSLSKSDVVYLEKYMALLRKKTGVYIDPYGTTRLYPNHGKILFNSIKHQGYINDKIKNFLLILQRAMDENEVLLFEGD
jgi:hypothetical protein